MADSFTPNYTLTLVEVGSSTDTWGGKLNANFTAIDTALKGVSDVAAGALPKAGGTMTGALVLAADPTTALQPATKQYVDTGLTGKAATSHTHPASQISDASANGRSLITAADYAAMRTLLGITAAQAIATAAEIWSNVADRTIDTDAAWASMAPVSVPYAATLTIDLAAGFNFDVAALTGNITTFNFSNATKIGQSGRIKLPQDGTGGRVISAYGAAVVNTGGASFRPVLSTAPSAVDYMDYEVRASGSVEVRLVSKAVA